MNDFVKNKVATNSDINPKIKNISKSPNLWTINCVKRGEEN